MSRFSANYTSSFVIYCDCRCAATTSNASNDIQVPKLSQQWSRFFVLLLHRTLKQAGHWKNQDQLCQCSNCVNLSPPITETGTTAVFNIPRFDKTTEAPKNSFKGEWQISTAFLQHFHWFWCCHNYIPCNRILVQIECQSTIDLSPYCFAMWR